MIFDARARPADDSRQTPGFDPGRIIGPSPLTGRFHVCEPHAYRRSPVCADVRARARRAATRQHQHPAGETLGTVNFKTSCSPARPSRVQSRDGAAPLVRVRTGDRGLHRGREGRPSRARWRTGASRSRAGPIRSPRRSARRRRSSRVSPRSPRRRQAAPKTDRERDYIAAAAKLFVDADKLDQRTRVVAYEQAMRDLAAKYPDDREASIFWALSLTASALPTDKTLRESAEGRRDSREALSRADRIIPASRTTSFTATTCRRSPTRPGRGGAALRDDRAVGAARAAHAVAYVHAGRRVAGVDRHEHRVGRRRAQGQRARRRAARDGLHGLRVPAERAGQGRADADRTASRDRGRRSIPTPSRAPRRVRPASSRWPRFPRAGRSSIATGKPPRR